MAATEGSPHPLRQTKEAPPPTLWAVHLNVMLAIVASSLLVLELDKGAPHTWAAQAALLSGILSSQGHLLCWTAEQMA